MQGRDLLDMEVDTGFFHNITTEYGYDVVGLLKSWMNINRRLALARNRRIYLLTCRTKNVSPKHIANNIKCIDTLYAEESPYTNDIANVKIRFQKSVLNLEIKIILWKLKRLEKEISSIKAKIENRIPADVSTTFFRKTQETYDRHFNLIKKNNLKKIQCLCDGKATFRLETKKNLVFNYTNVQLPESVIQILGVGPKFNIPCHSGSKYRLNINIIKDFEYILNSQSDFSEEAKNDLRSSFTNITTNHCNAMKRNNKKNNLFLTNLIATKKFLQDHPECMVSKSDKGNSTVFMYKDDYMTAMSELVNDETTYRTLRRDPTSNFQTKNNDLVKDLFNQQMISEPTMKKLRTHNSLPPRLYGLRKTHKPNLSMRPIVSCLNSPTYNLSNFIHQILSPWTTTFDYNVKNSLELVEFLKTVQLPPNYVMVSLDVVSLFTNIPKHLVLQIIKENWSHISAYTELDKTMLCRIIDFIFESSYFVFNGQIYLQIEGSAMGNPASPTLANIVMNYLISKCVKKLSFVIPVLKLYVDDTFIAVPNDKIDEFLETFNAFHPRIQFTLEKEVDNSIAFLDVQLIRKNDGTILTNWHTKATASNRVLNYFSHHPQIHKNNTIKNLCFRCYSLSSKEFWPVNEMKIKNILRKNNYPRKLINKIMHSYKHKFVETTRINTERREKDGIIYYKFPYIEGLSEKVGNLIKNQASNIKLAFYPLTKLENIYTKLKDSVPKLMTSNLVYQIPCKDCNLSYVGMTKQYLKNRIRQHKYDCQGKNIDKNEKTALAVHHFQENHNLDFDEVKILDKECNYHKRCISEMIHISIHDTMNIRTDTQKLSIIYNNLLREIK